MRNETLHLLKLDNVPIFQQLQIEEALLRADERNWCILNTGSTPAIVMGISGKIDLLINQDLTKTKPIPIIRRFSGGGTVVVDEHTCFATLIGNSNLLDGPCFPARLLSFAEQLYAPAFQGIDFRLQENDYVSGNKKFGGNAQYICKNRWLHHTSILWDYDESHMNYLLMPPKIPKYRESRRHADFLCRLKDHYPEKGAVSDNIIKALQRRFIVKEADVNLAKEITLKEHRKATHFV